MRQHAGQHPAQFSQHPGASALHRFYESLTPVAKRIIVEADDSETPQKHQLINTLSDHLGNDGFFEFAYMAGVPWNALRNWFIEKNRFPIQEALYTVPLTMIKGALEKTGKITMSDDYLPQIQKPENYEQLLDDYTLIQSRDMSGDFVSRSHILKLCHGMASTDAKNALISDNWHTPQL